MSRFFLFFMSKNYIGFFPRSCKNSFLKQGYKNTFQKIRHRLEKYKTDLGKNEAKNICKGKIWSFFCVFWLTLWYVDQFIYLMLLWEKFGCNNCLVLLWTHLSKMRKNLSLNSHFLSLLKLYWCLLINAKLKA